MVWQERLAATSCIYEDKLLSHSQLLHHDWPPGIAVSRDLCCVPTFTAFALACCVELMVPVAHREKAPFCTEYWSLVAARVVCEASMAASAVLVWSSSCSAA